MSETTNTQRKIYSSSDWTTGDAITAGRLNDIEHQLKFLSEEVNNAIDNTIYGDDAHGQGDLLSQRINNLTEIIVNSENQPTAPNNKIWIKNDSNADQVIVPTMNDLNDFENTIVNVVENIAEIKDNQAQFSDGWIKTNKNVGEWIDMKTIYPSDECRYAIINCHQEQQYYIQGQGASSARLWRFVDKNDLSIDDFDEGSDDSKYNKGSTGFKYYTGKRTVPSGAVKLIINDKSGKGVAYRIRGENKLLKLEQNIQHINNTMNIYNKEMKQVPGHLYIDTNGQLKILSADRKERLICVKGEPNTAYVIKKNTATQMRIGCGVSNNLTVDTQLFPYTMHTQSSSEPLQIITDNDNIYIYIHLFSDNDNDTSIEEEIKSLTIIKKDKTFNILLVGNSYTIDEFAYVPSLLKELKPNLAFNFCMLYEDSSSLQDHVNGLPNKNITEYTCYEYNDLSDHWKETTNVKLSTVINKYPYDIVVFTEKSEITSFDDSKQNLQELINSYSALLNHPVNFFWHLSHTPQKNQSTYQEKSAMAQAALAESKIYDIFASGTAIENACTITSLDSLGEEEHMRVDDTYYHLQNGLPRLIAAYTNVLKIFELIGEKNIGIYGSKIRPTGEWVTAQQIPQQVAVGQSQCVGINDENCLLGVKCALAAIKNPFNITDYSDNNNTTNYITIEQEIAAIKQRIATIEVRLNEINNTLSNLTN